MGSVDADASPPSVDAELRVMDNSAVSAVVVALEMVPRCTFAELLMAALTISVAFMTRGAGAEPSEAVAAGSAAVGGPSWMVGMVRFDEVLMVD